MNTLIYFLNKNTTPVYLAISASFIYLFSVLYFITSASPFVYLILLSFIFLFVVIFYIKYKYKKELPDILRELDKIELDEFKKSIYTKFININKEYLDLFFNKINESKKIIHLRFNDSSLFKQRIDSLLFTSVTSFTDNLEALNNIYSIQETSTIDYSLEIEQLESSNNLVLSNLDIFIKELLLEKASKEKSDELNNDFLRTFNLFNKIKGN